MDTGDHNAEGDLAMDLPLSKIVPAAGNLPPTESITCH